MGFSTTSCSLRAYMTLVGAGAGGHTARAVAGRTGRHIAWGAIDSTVLRRRALRLPAEANARARCGRHHPHRPFSPPVVTSMSKWVKTVAAAPSRASGGTGDGLHKQAEEDGGSGALHNRQSILLVSPLALVLHLPEGLSFAGS
ncbi:hypothetical protein [Oryza sativa Japonica Group]|uniref:OSJNBa0004B13.10 protein n=1 Tax=Oryza sativa subsp. japonica TaxID=39947 RepID=Q9ARY8_ORYSJ|nr:OSJNBa0004B13.10 [Oryza sativa Japonica Group]BAB64216.1 hypothetical protein [Oryza sativa Japonica Group]